jgi:hypothetical protein
MPLESLKRDHSWVIVAKADRKPMFETYSETLVRRLNTEKYEAIGIREYLASLNTTHNH